MALAARDRATRDDLARDGSFFEAYHPAMAEVQTRNAVRLAGILDRYGWPGRSQVGDDGSEAAWLVLQHAIGSPSLLRRGLEMVRQAVAQGEAEPWQVAMLEDRIRTLEGRPQLYGTQYDWDETGRLSPLPIQDPEAVDSRRQAMGLAPMGENTARIRARAAESGEGAPRDATLRRRRQEEFARAVGWRPSTVEAAR